MLAKMVNKLLTPLARWSSKRIRKKQVGEKKTKEQQQKEAFYSEIRRVYNFAKWLNGKFPSRRARKQFWRSVSKGEPLVEKTLQDLLVKYNKKKELILMAKKKGKIRPVRKPLKTGKLSKTVIRDAVKGVMKTSTKTKKKETK